MTIQRGAVIVALACTLACTGTPTALSPDEPSSSEGRVARDGDAGQQVLATSTPVAGSLLRGADGIDKTMGIDGADDVCLRSECQSALMDGNRATLSPEYSGLYI